MVRKATARYIVFQYVAPHCAATGYPLAFLTIVSNESGHRRVRLYTSTQWKEHVPEEAVQLLEDTFADWESLSLEELTKLFPHLAQSGAGALQARTSGTCDLSRLRILLEEVLGVKVS